VGSALSSTVAEIFLHYFEDKYIEHLLDTKNATFYVRYVDDILINYDSKKINTPNLLPLVWTKLSKMSNLIQHMKTTDK
jgi:hypothetical protein